MIYNTKIIEYDDYIHIQWYDAPIIRKESEEKEDLQNENDSILLDSIVIDKKNNKRNLQVSLNRSKNNLYRIARSNDWDLFITITFDRKKVDSSSYDLVAKKISQFLNNIRKRKCPNLKYLIVPELHKDKIHYHFHGLISGISAFDLEDSGHVDKFGEKIYNITNWKVGFTTAQFIKDKNAVRNYIGKYISKDLMCKLKYKKRYYCSKNCNISPEEYKYISINELYDLYGDNISFIKTVTVNGVNRIKYLEIKKNV